MKHEPPVVPRIGSFEQPKTVETAARAGAGLNIAGSFRDARLARGLLMLIEVRLDLRGRRGGAECCFPEML